MQIYGVNPIKDLFKNKPSMIKKVYADKKRHQSFIIELQKNNIQIEPFKLFKEFRDVNHQEIIADIKEPESLSIQELIEKNKKVTNPVIIILDQINDPHNLGAIIRNVSAFGSKGIITSVHGSTPLNATVIKTSSGTWTNVDLVAETNLTNAIIKLKVAGYWIASMVMNGDKTLEDLKNFNRPLAIILGNEGKGIKKSLLDNSDLKVGIKMKSNTESLNVSVTAGIVLHYLK